MSFASLFVTTVKGAPLVLPMRAFYGFDRETERRRATFYKAMAAEFSWAGWRLAAPPTLKSKRAGRGGQQQDIHKGTHKNPADRDRRASVAEFVQYGTLLDDPTPITASDRVKDEARNYGDIRRTAARELADYHDDVVSGHLKSPEWLKAGQGSARSGSYAPSVILSAGQLTDVRQGMPEEQYAIIEKAIFRDVYFWEVPENEDEPIISIQARKILLEDFRMALDFAAVTLGHLSRERLLRRWHEARQQLLLRPAIERAKRARG